MNHLNSVLLEGTVVDDPRFGQENGTPWCVFAIASHRACHENGKNREAISVVEAKTYGRLATACAEDLKKGRGVRVVGRLEQAESDEGDSVKSDNRFQNRLYLVAEHVEFKPVPRSAERDEPD